MAQEFAFLNFQMLLLLVQEPHFGNSGGSWVGSEGSSSGPPKLLPWVLPSLIHEIFMAGFLLSLEGFTGFPME